MNKFPSGKIVKQPSLASPDLIFHFSDSNLITEVQTALYWLNRMLSCAKAKCCTENLAPKTFFQVWFF